MEVVKKEMGGKICLVTGASRGIGFYVARELASMGATVVLASHHQERGKRASRRINAHTGKDSTMFMLVDLSSQQQIRAFTQEFKEQYGRLDALINNAGGFFLAREESVDGIEMTFALNHLNYFMTTLLLMDTLLAAESARIVNVSSESHRGEKMRFNDLQFERGYSGLKAYGQSKLTNLLFTYELSRRLGQTTVTVNALHPGFVHTYLGKQNMLVRVVMNVIHFLFAKRPEEGAETPVYLASSPQVAGVTGKYYIDEEPVRSSPASYNEEAAKRLWNISAELCGLQAFESALGYLEATREKHEYDLVKK